MFERWGRCWELVRGYAVVEPEGWFLELHDIANGDIVLIARWPEEGELVVTAHRDDMTPEMTKWFTDQAKVAIAPVAAEPEPGP
jgi:hypothetical protein